MDARLMSAQTSTLSPTNSILTQMEGYTNTRTHTTLCCANTSKCRCSLQDKCETFPPVLFEMVLWSQMLVRGYMFVTKCLTYKDQGRSSHTNVAHVCRRMDRTAAETKRKDYGYPEFFLTLLHQMFKKPSKLT